MIILFIAAALVSLKIFKTPIHYLQHLFASLRNLFVISSFYWINELNLIIFPSTFILLFAILFFSSTTVIVFAAELKIQVYQIHHRCQ